MPQPHGPPLHAPTRRTPAYQHRHGHAVRNRDRNTNRTSADVIGSQVWIDLDGLDADVPQFWRNFGDPGGHALLAWTGCGPGSARTRRAKRRFEEIRSGALQWG